MLNEIISSMNENISMSLFRMRSVWSAGIGIEGYASIPQVGLQLVPFPAFKSFQNN